MLTGREAAKGYAPQFDATHPTVVEQGTQGRYVGHYGVTVMAPHVRQLIVGKPDGTKTAIEFNSDVAGVIEETPTGVDIGVVPTDEIVTEARRHPDQVTEAWLLTAAGIERPAPEVPAQAEAPTEELVSA